MGGFWEGFEGDLIGFWALAAELLAVACLCLLLLTLACFGLLWLALPALAALSVPLLLRFEGVLVGKCEGRRAQTQGILRGGLVGIQKEEVA